MGFSPYKLSQVKSWDFILKFLSTYHVATLADLRFLSLDIVSVLVLYEWMNIFLILSEDMPQDIFRYIFIYACMYVCLYECISECMYAGR